MNKQPSLSEALEAFSIAWHDFIVAIGKAWGIYRLLDYILKQMDRVAKYIHVGNASSHNE